MLTSRCYPYPCRKLNTVHTNVCACLVQAHTLMKPYHPVIHHKGKVSYVFLYVFLYAASGIDVFWRHNIQITACVSVPMWKVRTVCAN